MVNSFSMEQSQIVGCILGAAVGDAIGLPYEGLPRSRARRLLGVPDSHRLLFRYGMVSDDTEHICMVAQSLIASHADIDLFQEQFARRLRLWLLGLPAGVGLATLRSALKLWMGFNSKKSGVFSAGNGPAMRAAILGAAIDDRKYLRSLVKASTQITHTDPKAEFGALAVAIAVQMARDKAFVSGEQFVEELKSYLFEEGKELIVLVTRVIQSVSENQKTSEFADLLDLHKGVSGYVYHTVPIALHAWLSHQDDYRLAIIAVVECGGDTDTIAAIVGGIVGSSVGKEGIPPQWLNSILEWPRSVTWMEHLGTQLHQTIESGKRAQPIALPIYGVLIRNLFFLIVVLSHGIRRLLPPY